MKEDEKELFDIIDKTIEITNYIVYDKNKKRKKFQKELKNLKKKVKEDGIKSVQ